MKLYTVPIYGYKLHISIGEDAKQIVSGINKKLKTVKLTPDDVNNIKGGFDEPKAVGFFLDLNISGHGLIWLDSKLDPKDSSNFIAMSHEVIHATVQVFEFIGTSVNTETEEPFCYLHDELMKVCLRELEKSKNGNKNTVQNKEGLLQ